MYGGPGAPSPGAGIGYTMWAVNSTGMWVVGYRSDYDGHGEKNVFINPLEMLMPVPCAYGHNQDYDSKWEVTIGYVPTDYDTLYRSRTHKNINCDAWGSMTTPYGSFSNVIRVHEFSVTTDSAFVVFGGTTYFSLLFKKDTINKYLFWAPNERHPVAIAYCSNAGVLQRIEYVSWAQLYVPQVEENELSFAVYPNPASDKITVRFPEAFKNEESVISIFDLTGKLITTQAGFGNEISMSLESYDKGMYLIEAKMKSGSVFKSEFTVK